MKYVPLGRSGLMVSRVCLGGNSWGARGRRAWAGFDAGDSAPFFKRALDRGINFFDTADVYNFGASETIMGETLMGYAPRDELVISTKVGIKMSDKPNFAGLGAKHVLASIDQQLKRLKTDHIDVYQVHRLDPHTPVEEFMATLDGLVRAGKVRYIGGSTMPAYKFAQMIAASERFNYARPVAMQNLHNLIQREDEREMNALCQEAGVGLIPYSPLARGFLAGNRVRGGGGETERAKNDAGAKPETYRDCDWQIVDALKAIAAARGVKPTQVAFLWLWSKPYMAAPIMGATKPEQIDEAAAAADMPPLTAAEIERLESPYQWRVHPGWN
ncbi:MAG: aldo/keto reductase [Alphaproteobacteria bacterium]|nr:aldo/keto reductase [Alphaproteobacteria bacterium]